MQNLLKNKSQAAIEPFDIHDEDDISQQEAMYRCELRARGIEEDRLEIHVRNRMYGWRRSLYKRPKKTLLNLL